jgi:hypothetical protein
MASITYWNRLEPRPRSEAIDETLAARVRDPLWFLTRQWQFGEFRGADGGSPAFATVTFQEATLVAWQSAGTPPRPLGRGAPFERQVLAEAYPAEDLSLAVELGQLFEGLLPEARREALTRAFRASYPIPVHSDAELAAMPDPEQARFLRVCGGRALDGVALYRATATLPTLPNRPAVAPADRDAVRAALTAFRGWVDETYGPLGGDDPAPWDPARLSHALDVIAVAPTGGTLALAADPGSDGDFDWDAFDLRAAPAPAPGTPLPAVTTTTQSLIPANVRFRGMPNARWWAFENGSVDFGDIRPEKRDLARLLLMDFMLIHGNDWFLLPLEQRVGTLGRVESLVVRDVFGRRTHVERADAGAAAPGARWTMFSTSIEGVDDRVADFLVLPGTAAAALQLGTAVEEVRFLRDELANMAWAIEHTTASAVGEPWPGHERDQRLRAAAPPEPGPAVGPDSPPIRYRLQTGVPEHWLPLLPVAIDPARGEVALELGAMLRPQPSEPILPVGRLLRPTRLAGGSYRIREEEVPRAGTRVARVVCRTRWLDGSTHVWVQRRRTIGSGEGSSGLRFDLAILQRPTPPTPPPP